MDDLKAGVQRWALAAIAACTAESATFPIDFCKTRLQLQNELGRALTGEAATVRLGMVQTFAHVYQTEGLLAMYNGLGAAALRQAVYGGIGIGLYAPVRALMIGADVDPKDAPLWKRIAAGALTGAIGQTIASPTDVVKVRLQADGRLKSLGQAPRYKVRRARTRQPARLRCARLPADRVVPVRRRLHRRCPAPLAASTAAAARPLPPVRTPPPAGDRRRVPAHPCGRGRRGLLQGAGALGAARRGDQRLRHRQLRPHETDDAAADGAERRPGQPGGGRIRVGARICERVDAL